MLNHESTFWISTRFFGFAIPGSLMDVRYMFDADGNQSVPHREWILDFEQAISEVKAALKEQGRGDEFIGAKVGNLPDSISHGNAVTRVFIDHIHHHP
jgi:hypothetical protein